MKHKQKLHVRTLSIDDYTSILPAGDFIAIFGTSHSAGACEKDGFQFIETADRWCNIVAKSLGIEVVNFSVPGNTNKKITHQIMDFLELPGVKERCKLIIGEVRTGDFAGEYYYDLVTNNLDTDKFLPNKVIAEGTDLHTFAWSTRVLGHFALTKDPTESRIRDLVVNAGPNNKNPPNTALNLLKQKMLAHRDTVLLSSESIMNDIIDIRAMCHITSAAGIPFKYFVWDGCKMADVLETIDVIRDLYYSTYPIHEHMFNAISPNLLDQIKKDGMSEHWRTSECECGHKDERGHEIVADYLMLEIKDILENN